MDLKKFMIGLGVVVAVGLIAFFVRSRPTPKGIISTTSGSGLVVIYTDQGFQPDAVTVPAGVKVSFENISSGEMWVASDPHPIHTDVPGFDAGQPLKPGESYTFTFTTKGTIGYHDHLHPTQTGLITVE